MCRSGWLSSWCLLTNLASPSSLPLARLALPHPLRPLTMQQLWLVTIPNRGESPEATYTSLQRLVPTTKIHRFEIPGLVVGTLDSLMALSDDLTKINTQVEVRMTCLPLLSPSPWLCLLC